MLTLQEFDVRCRGSAQVVAEWDTPDSRIHQLWRIEDLVSIATDTIAAATTIYEQFQQQGGLSGA